MNSKPPVADGTEWERMWKGSKIFGGCNLRKGKDLRFCRICDYESHAL